MPQDVAKIRREHVEAFVTHLLDRWKPATAGNRFRRVQVFSKWLVEEGETKEPPMAKMLWGANIPSVYGGSSCRPLVLGAR
jgi:hypothetical protein